MKRHKLPSTGVFVLHSPLVQQEIHLHQMYEFLISLSPCDTFRIKTKKEGISNDCVCVKLRIILRYGCSNLFD